MKKILFGAASAIIMYNNVANAAYIEVNPYIGGNLSMQEFNYSRNLGRIIEDDFNTLSIYAGANIERYVSIEAFIERASLKSYKQSIVKTTSNHIAYGVDLLGHIPVYKDLDIIAGLGIGEYKFKAKEVGVFHATYRDAALGTRLTTGVELNLDYNWALRATYRYTSFSNSFVNRSNEISFGVRYSF